MEEMEVEQLKEEVARLRVLLYTQCGVSLRQKRDIGSSLCCLSPDEEWSHFWIRSRTER
jgi:hypothetical protein